MCAIFLFLQVFFFSICFKCNLIMLSVCTKHMAEGMGQQSQDQNIWDSILTAYHV